MIVIITITITIIVMMMMMKCVRYLEMQSIRYFRPDLKAYENLK